MFWGGLFGEGGVKTPGTTPEQQHPPQSHPPQGWDPRGCPSFVPTPISKKDTQPLPPTFEHCGYLGWRGKTGAHPGNGGEGGRKKKKNPNPKIYQTPKIYPNTKIYPVPSSCPWGGGMAQHRGGHMLPPPPTPSWSLVPSPGWQRVQRAWLAWACGDHAALGGWWWRWGAGHDPIFPPTAVPPSLPSELRGEGAQRGVVGGLGRRLGVVATPCAPPAPCQLRTPPCRRGRSRPAWPRCCCCPAR